MKRVFTLSTILFISMQLMSQVYLIPEDFSGETFPPDNWTIEDGGTIDNTFQPGPMPVTSAPSCAWIETSPNIEIDDRIITPSITLPEGTEAKFYAQLRGSVGYAITQYWDPDNLVQYFIEVSTDNGESWEAILDLDNSSSVANAGVSFPWPDWAWFDVAIDVSAYAGQTVKFAFHHIKDYVPTGGGSFGITNVGVWEDIENDVELRSLSIADYGLINTAIEANGTFKNIANNDVNSFEGQYFINGELSGSFSYDDLSVSQFDYYSFTIADDINLSEAEIHLIEVIITSVNGQSDPSEDNNVLDHIISIASESVTRKPLFEVFTSSTCAPCLDANEQIDATLTANDIETYSLIKNQTSWPGNGDPYTNEDGALRVDYYTVGGVPTLKVNGKSSTSYLTQTIFNQASEEAAYVDLGLEFTYNGINVAGTMTINPKLSIDDASVHFAVAEKTTFNNVGSNGETEFHHVMMKMMPDGNGSSVSLEAGVEETVSIDNTNLITTFIEEFDDLIIVCWVQDNLTKSVLQSESSDLWVTTGIDDQMSRMNTIYPNPNNGRFSVNAKAGSFIRLMDSQGMLVYSSVLHKMNTQIDASGFSEGIYFVQVIEDKNIILCREINY